MDVNINGREDGDGDPILADPRKRLLIRLSVLCDEYVDQAEALFDLMDAVAPGATELDSITVAGQGLASVFRRMPSEAIDKMGKLWEEGLKGQASSKTSSFLRALSITFEGESWLLELMTEWLKFFQRQPRMPLLWNSLLTAAVGSFEVLLASIVSEFYRSTPQALEALPREREREFSLRDLKAMTTLEDAVDLAISRRVDELLFGSLSDWRKFFKDRLNIDFATLGNDWNETQEVFQRRHIIVHNGGRVSARYLANVKAIDSDKPLVIGDTLHCDDGYLKRGIEHLLTFGTLLLMAVIKKFEQPEVYQPIDLLDLQYKMLVHRRWIVADRLGLYGQTNSTTSGEQAVYSVNRWIARKELYGIESISAEVREWDVSAMHDRYRLAKHALLDEENSALHLLEKLVPKF